VMLPALDAAVDEQIVFIVDLSLTTRLGLCSVAAADEADEPIGGVGCRSISRPSPNWVPSPPTKRCEPFPAGPARWVETSMADYNELLERVERLKMFLVQHATGSREDDSEYVKLRRSLLAEPAIRGKLPSFLRYCTNLGEFWGHIKEKFGTYQERRNYLRDEFLLTITMLESGLTPSDPSTSAALSNVDSDHVRDAWQKALDRRESDPDGAITSARTLIEAVCKHILDETGTPYQDDWQLPQLYSEVAKQLKLSPAQHSEDIFKQILGGCHSVINGMAGLRNRFSDAHGKGKAGVKPAPRHAELAVNLAGSVATFLIATWEARTMSGGKQA
jgi:hypothetical protein